MPPQNSHEFLSAAGWLSDLRFACRSFIRTPLFTLASVLSLALGIGAATALFTVIDTVLFRPLPYASPERLVVIDIENRSQNLHTPMSASVIREWQRTTTVLDGLASYLMTSFTLAGDEQAARIAGVRASAAFFSVLGVKPLMGAAFSANEDQPGHNDVIVISYDLWIDRYGGDPAVIGRELLLNDQKATIIGVMPPGFNFPSSAEAPAYSQGFDRIDAWTPLALSAAEMDNPVEWSYSTVGRVKPGVQLQQVQVELAPAFDTILDTVLKGAPPGWGVSVRFLSDKVSGEFRRSGLFLFAGSLLLLLIACTNVATLLFVRSSRRQGEIATRMALGLAPGRLVRMLLTESCVLGSLGGIVGIGFAFLVLRIIALSAPPALLPRVDEISINESVAVFCTVLSLLSSLSAGLAPVLFLTRTPIRDALAGSFREAPRGLPRRIRKAFAIGQLAVTLVLVAVTVLLVRSFTTLVSIHTGFETEHITTLRISMRGVHYRAPDLRSRRVDDIVQRCSRVPNILSIGGIDQLPLTGRGRAANGLVIEGHPADEMHKLPVTELFAVTPNYFRTMGIPVKQGRVFQEEDAMGGRPVAVVSETAARRLWPAHQSAVGSRLRIGASSWIEVVGVVGDVRSSSLTLPPKPQIYRPYHQDSGGQVTLVIRSGGEASNIIPIVRSEIWSIDRNLPIDRIRSMDKVLSMSVSRERFLMLVCSVFAAFALLLAGVGIYGLVSYSVALRVNEIGIRKALGASDSETAVMIMKEMFAVLTAGAIVGLILTLAVSKVMGAFVYGIAATDLTSFVASVAVLAGVGVVAAWIPARRAAHTEPTLALRQY